MGLIHYFSNAAINKVLPKNTIVVFAQKHGTKNSEYFANERKKLQELNTLAPKRNVIIETSDYWTIEEDRTIPVEMPDSENRLLVVKASVFYQYEVQLNRIDNGGLRKELANMNQRKTEYKLIVRENIPGQYQPELVELWT